MKLFFVYYKSSKLGKYFGFSQRSGLMRHLHKRSYTQMRIHTQVPLDILYGGFGFTHGKGRKKVKKHTKETFIFSVVTTHIFHMGSTRASHKRCCLTMLF